MTGLPARCPNCGPFISKVIDIPNSINASISLTVRCPNCGAWSKSIEGVFDVLGDEYIPRAATPFSLSILDQLKEIARKSKDQVPTNDQLISNISIFSPELARALEPIAKTRAPWFLLLIIWWIISNTHVNLDVKVDFNQLVTQAYHAVQHEHPHGALGQEEKAEGGKLSVEATLKADVGRKETQSEERQKLSKRQIRRERGRTGRSTRR